MFFIELSIRLFTPSSEYKLFTDVHFIISFNYKFHAVAGR